MKPVLCEMKNGRPCSAAGERFGQPDGIDNRLLSDLKPADQKAVMDWIFDNLEMIKTPNYNHSSYGIKHLLQRDINLYISNNQMKDAMLQSGYKPAKINELNWNFNVSERSKAFRKKVW